MEVIGDESEAETALLGLAREANEIVRPVLFARKRVSDVGQ
jgi:hypothetical protein